ncbi:P-loop NTPase fold protein [Pseudomonas sp. GM48]|uniref:P-loop NTPase fold protein n=1 Tax=Pseudomonas sp. GM48 TaxID=1144330 RepID=UPI0002704A6B|nr:P-loop NTPase fold protein [Pseudomonas sp. GM48]EJM53510.1 KAP family P-loop domain protein [Pseudomonas sp. GM48]
MSNSHIHDFALEYCFSPTPPQYALLLKGAWGSGKTWFVEKLANAIRKKEGRELYISLYGLNSFSAIEYEFYRKLHPILSNKGMEIAGKVLRGALKATLKVDLDMDGKPDGSASISIPSLNLPEYLRNTSGLVLIFDDIERCSIKLSDLLGYINHFVEHQDYKVILVANEDELVKDENYKTIKEKLVGKTFEITPQIDDALDNFINDTGSEQFFEAHRELIKETHFQSNYKNLRHLRQALLDFARLEHKLPEDVTQSSELMAHLLRLFLIFTIEIRHGKMSACDIGNLKKQWIAYAVSEKREKQQGNHEKPLATTLVEKYRNFDTHDTLIEQDVWLDILGSGIINSDVICDQLKNSKYLFTESSPTWVRLWNFRSHTDDEFRILVSEVWNQFENSQLTAHYELKHVFGMMLFFSDNGLINKSIDQIIVTAKNCVTVLRKDGHFNKRRITGFRDDESAMGMGYIYCEREEFREFCEHLKQQEEEAYLDTFPTISIELLALLKAAPSDFSQQLHSSNYGSGTYYDVPILNSLAPSAFVEALLALKANELDGACQFFRERYRNKSMSDIVKEREWVVSVKTLLERETKARAGTLFGHCLKEIINRSINRALVDLPSETSSPS